MAATAGAAVILALPTEGVGAFGCPAPFEPEQCQIALMRASDILQATPGDTLGLRMQAEGLLCLGLQGDVAALDGAIAQLARISPPPRSDFFGHLYLAEAWRARFFLSDEALAAFEQARDILASADVGGAAAYLSACVDQRIRQSQELRSHYLDHLDQRAHAFARGELSPFQIGSWLTLLSQTGPAGLRQAVSVLESYVARQPEPMLEFLFRAELLRGHLPKTTLRRLYRNAADALCTEVPDPGKKEERQACGLARDRLRALAGASQAVPPS